MKSNVVENTNDTNSLITLHEIDFAETVFNHLDINKNTKKEYSYRIGLFTSYLQSHGFTQNSFIEYKHNLSEKTDFSISTKNKYLIVARIFCKELHKKGYLPVDITQNVKSFQQSRKHKKDGFTENEIQQIISYIHSQENSLATCRKKALLSLLILQGLRQIEIVRLNMSDLNLVLKRAYIQGKGRDDKELIDLHPVTVATLKNYIRIWRIGGGALFRSTSNNSKNHRLTTRSIRNIIDTILDELDIDCTVHGFRHYYTTKLLESFKGDLLTVAQYTRHKSLEMLQVYNDAIKRKEDLPRYYSAFEKVRI